MNTVLKLLQSLNTISCLNIFVYTVDYIPEITVVKFIKKHITLLLLLLIIFSNDKYEKKLFYFLSFSIIFILMLTFTAFTRSSWNNVIPCVCINCYIASVLVISVSSINITGLLLHIYFSFFTLKYKEWGVRKMR